MIEVSVSPLYVSGEKFSQSTIAIIENSADFVHIDVMDGKFVPRKTFAPEVVRGLKIGVPKDIHLMVDKPEEVWESYIDGMTEMLSFHVEACEDPISLINKIKAKNIKVGIALSPKSSILQIERYINDINFVLVMSVEPGEAGQGFIPEVLEKVRELRKLALDLDIEIDGGINYETGEQAVEAGATILVASSFIFTHASPSTAIDILRNL